MKIYEVISTPSGALLPDPQHLPAEVVNRTGRWCAVVATHRATRYDADFSAGYDSYYRALFVARLWAAVVHVWLALCGADDGISWAVLDLASCRRERT